MRAWQSQGFVADGGHVTDQQSTGEQPGTSLKLRFIKDIKEKFFVPRYQRGYRWGEHEVTRLLDDIRANGSQPYSLQPIVVKQRPGGDFELVDGQQRLTTLYLILAYMHREGLKSIGPPYTIAYETRPGSEAYLRNLDKARSQENIDFFHLRSAYDHIGKWFEQFGAERQLEADEFYRALLKFVRVIWYVAPPELDSTALFTRLNVGRIPLTDAELVKALLLTRVLQGKDGGDRAKEVADQWDAIERDLRDPDVWAFVGDARAQDRPTRITLLLDTLAGKWPGKERPLFHTFDTLQARITTADAAKHVWEDVLDLHALLRGWFDDRSIYHKVGYLVAVGIRFAEIVELAGGRRKSEFEADLDALIRKRLALSASDVRELGYDSNPDKCGELLLLMNVETVRLLKDSTERYSFHQHRLGKWSLEHIHAQHAEGLTKEVQWKEWLKSHLEALKRFPDDGLKGRRDALIARIVAAEAAPTRRSFDEVSRDVSEFFTLAQEGGAASTYSVHSLGNLALLDGESNSAFNNSVFEVKRQRMLERDRAGAYIPICTRRVFLKYYTDAGAQQLHLWSPQDQEHYLGAMISPENGVLRPYLQGEERAP